MPHRNQIQNWRAETAPLPTWRDGLGGTDRTYMIIATPHQSRKGYQAIVYGRFGGGSGKIKFYPNPESLGIDRRSLTAMGMHDCLDRPDEPYTRYMATLDQVQKLLAGLEPAEWAVCPAGELREALIEQRGRADSLTRHPRDHQMTETSPEPSEVQDAGGIKVQPVA